MTLPIEHKVYLLLIAFALFLGGCLQDDSNRVTLTQTKQITQPDEVSKRYVTSGTIQSYRKGTDWADIAFLQAVSPAMLQDLLKQITDLAEIQGFKQLGEKSGAKVYMRTWDPMLQQATSEYMEVLAVDQKLVIISRGTNPDLVHELIMQAMTTPSNALIKPEATKQATFSRATTPTAVPRAVPTTRRILVDVYHGFDLGGSTKWRDELKKDGYLIVDNSKPLDLKTLKEHDILLVDLAAYFGKRPFSSVELDAIRSYIDQGGGVFLIGLGWVWTSYGKQPIDAYPFNLIAKNYGVWFKDDYLTDSTSPVRLPDQKEPYSPVFYKPFMANHPLTSGVNRVACFGIPGSLVVSSPSVPIIWGDDDSKDFQGTKNPVTMAATVTPLGGRIVFLQHGGYFTDDDGDKNGISNIYEYDNLRLLRNIIKWLAKE